jgi:hypothetical protein
MRLARNSGYQTTTRYRKHCSEHGPKPGLHELLEHRVHGCPDTWLMIIAHVIRDSMRGIWMNCDFRAMDSVLTCSFFNLRGRSE